jgi:hypothetical protein
VLHLKRFMVDKEMRCPPTVLHGTSRSTTSWNPDHDRRLDMKYLLLLHSPDGPPQDHNGVEYAETFAAYAAANAAMAEAGVLLDCAPLQPASASTTVRVRDGRTIVTDGPAAEIKEQVGGYTLLECADLDEALQWAAMIPSASTGWVEVRPIIATPSPF